MPVVLGSPGEAQPPPGVGVAGASSLAPNSADGPDPDPAHTGGWVVESWPWPGITRAPLSIGDRLGRHRAVAEPDCPALGAQQCPRGPDRRPSPWGSCTPSWPAVPHASARPRTASPLSAPHTPAEPVRVDDAGHRARFLIRDRDGKFPPLFDVILADVGIQVVEPATPTPRPPGIPTVLRSPTSTSIDTNIWAASSTSPTRPPDLQVRRPAGCGGGGLGLDPTPARRM